MSTLLVNEDALDILCGRLLGSGETRMVFDCAILPGYVVKVEQKPDSFHNIREYDIWSTVMYKPESKWFAEVKYMSKNGRILIMEKTRPPGFHEWPEQIPRFFADVKQENFGMTISLDPRTGKVTNRFVAHDYANHNLYETGLTKRMRKVDWNAE